MFRVAKGTLHATAAGTADFTFTGLGTCAGAIVIINGSTAASNPENTPSPGWLSQGYFDGTNQVAKAEHSTDAESTTTDAWKYSWSAAIGGYTNNAGTVQQEYSCAAITDGIRITTDTTDGTAYNCMVILIPATGTENVKAWNQDWSGAAVGPGGAANVVDTSVGFEADLVFGMCGVNPGPANVDVSIQTGWGITHNVDGTDGNIEQMSVGYSVNDGRGLPGQSTFVSLGVSDVYGILNMTNQSSPRYGTKLTGFGATGFTATKYETWDTTTLKTAAFALAEDQMYLAIKFTGAPDIKIFHEIAPTATGSFAVTDPGFLPDFGMMMTPDHTPATINQADTSSSNGLAFVAFDATIQHSVGYIDDDNVTTTDVTLWAEDGLQMYEHGGVSKFTASFTSFDATGWTWNFSDADGADADNWVALAIGAADAASADTNGFIAVKVPWTQQPPPGTPLRKDGIFNRAKWFAHFGRGHPFEEKLQEKGTFDTNAGPVVTSDIGLVGEFPTASLDGSCDFVKHDDIHVGVTEMTLCVWAKNRKATKLTGSSESAASYTGTGNDPWDVRWGVDEDVDFLVEADSGNTTYQDNIVNALGVAQGGEDSQTWNMLGGTWSNDLLVARCNRQKGAGTATVGANTGDASATNNPRLGGRQAGQTNSWDGWILYGLWFDVDIGDAAWLAILENKWSVYEPRTVWVPTSLPAPGPAPAGFIDIKVPWTQQPPAGTKINKGHELARGLKFFTPCNEGGGDVIDNVTGARGSDVSDGTSTAVREANEYGRHVELFRGGDTEIAGYEFTSRAEWELNAQALTVIGHVKRTAAVPTSGSRVITKGSDAFSTGWGIVIPDDTSVRFNCRVGGGNSNAVATTGSNLDRDLFVAGRYDGTNITAFGRIGRSHSVNTADTADTGNINLDTNPLALGHLQGARRALTGNIYFTGVWERVLENTEIQSIWDNPWQIYEPRIIRIPVGIAAPIPDSAFIDRKIPWTRQPPPGTQLNKAHPLYNYIAYVQNFASINGPDGVGNLSPTIVDQTQGPGYLSTTGSAGDYYDTNFVPSVSNLTAPTNKVSTMMLARTTDVSGALWSYRDGATVVAQSAIDGTGWRLQSGGDTLTLDATTTEAADGEWHVLGTSLEVGTDGAGFIDGKIGSGGRVTSTSNGSDAAVNLAIGNRWQAYPTTGFESALDCQLFVMFVGISLSDVQHRQLAENPWQIYEPLSIRIPVGIAAAAVGNQNIAVGLATETDLAQPLTGTFTVPVGLVTETDLAQPITGAFTVPVGLVTETDLAQPLTGTFTVPVGLATETDLAQPLTGTFTVPVGLVTETDLAQPIVVQQSQSISIGLASETDLAQPVTGTFTVPIGQALETDLAQPLTGAFTVPVGLVTETDLAQPVSINLDLPVGLASETDLAQPLTGDFTVPVGLVTETDLAQPIVPVQGLVVNVGLATETDLAQPLTGTFTVPVGLASETDLAQPLTGAFTVLIGQASETDLAQPVSINMALPVGLATETDLAQPLTGTFTVPVGLATETDLAQPISQVTLTKTATVTVIGGENLSNLSWVVFDGYDVSTDPILLQGAGESTDGAGELVINLDSTGVINGDPVSIVITDYTTSPTATNMAAVCYATVVVA